MHLCQVLMPYFKFAYRIPSVFCPHRQIIQVQTAAERRYLYFNIVSGPGRNQTVTVEGGGVNATIVQADVAATNGYIHIIDKVLGVPYSTVLEKLKTDSMLR